MDQGFAPTSGFGEKIAARASHELPHAGPTAREAAAKGAVETAAGAKKLDPAHKKIAELETIKSRFMMPATFEIVGMLGGGVLGWVTNKFGWQRASAAIGMTLRAPVQALRETSISQVFHLPSNFFKAAGREAANAGNDAGNKAAGWAKAANSKADTWKKTAETMEARTADAVAPATKAMGDGLARFEATSAGKGLHGMVDRIMHGRKAAALSNHHAAFEKAQKALTTQAPEGFVESVGHFFKHTVMRNPAPTVAAGELSGIMHGLNASQGKSGAAKVSHLKDLSEKLESIMRKDSIGKEVKARASNVAKHLNKALGSAHALETYESAAGGSMRTMVKAMGKAVGRVPIFSALLAVGVTAGIGATLVSAKAESAEAKEAFGDLASQLADKSNSGFLQAVKDAQKSRGSWAAAKTGLKVVGNVADGAMWMLPGGGGVAMFGAVMLPNLCESLVPDNPLLGAYVALKKDEKGELKLAPEAKVEAIRQLVGAMPAVAAKGGYYNRLAAPIAGEMVSREMTAQQIIQTLGNDAAFTKISGEVATKRAEQANAVANDHHASGEVKAPAVMSSAEAAYMSAPKPSSMIAANDVQLAGKMTEANRQVG